MLYEPFLITFERALVFEAAVAEVVKPKTKPPRKLSCPEM